MAGRTIAIGDVHGCWQELEKLLEALSPLDGDRLWFLGDLVNHGPDSHRVVRIARERGARSLLGNHEHRLLAYRRLSDETILKDYDPRTLDKLDEDDWNYLETMKLHHYLPEEDTVFVHGGFLPGRPWRGQTVSVVTRIQVVDAQGEPRKRGESPGSPHWSTLWEGPPFVVYGHTPRREPKRTAWTLGIDTGCAYGGYLTAFVLPEKRIVQVRSRRVYVSKNL